MLFYVNFSIIGLKRRLPATCHKQHDLPEPLMQLSLASEPSSNNLRPYFGKWVHVDVCYIISHSRRSTRGQGARKLRSALGNSNATDVLLLVVARTYF